MAHQTLQAEALKSAIQEVFWMWPVYHETTIELTVHLASFKVSLTLIIITDNVRKWQSHFNSHKQYRIVYVNGICTCEVFFFIPKQVSTPSWSAIAT